MSDCLEGVQEAADILGGGQFNYFDQTQLWVDVYYCTVGGEGERNVGVTLAVFLLGDPLTVPLSMGAVAILGGVFIAQRR